MSGGCPPALLNSRSFLDALAKGPSRELVGHWVQHWDGLDAVCGAGHVLKLEEALFQAVALNQEGAFRAAWTLALLTESGSVQSPDLGDRLFMLLNAAETLPLQRELLRALLMLTWSDVQLDELTQWALHVVFLDDMPLSALHQSLKVIERRLEATTAPVGPELRREMLESLAHVGRNAASAHAKKKAALLTARLSD